MKRKFEISRFVTLLMMLILIVVMAGCGSSEPEKPSEQPTKGAGTPTPTTEPFEVPAINIPSPVKTEDDVTPTVAPTEAPVSLISEEKLAQTHWVAVRLKGTYYDGETYDEDLTQDEMFRYELLLFDDGTAQWLNTASDDGRLLDDPNGFWQISENNMIFSRHEDIALDDEYETRYFYEENGSLVLIWGETAAMYFEQTEMTEKVEPFSQGMLNGVWKWQSSEVEGYVYTDETVNKYLRFYTDYSGDGAEKADIYDNTAYEQFEGLSVEYREDYDIISGWAHWAADIAKPLDSAEDKMYAYLINEDCMCIEYFYYVDSAPAISIERYVRVPSHFGVMKLQEERTDKNIIWLTLEEYLWITQEDKDLIEKYGLPEDLDGYEYEIISSGEEQIVSMYKDSTFVSLIDWDDTVNSRNSNWQALVDRLLEDPEYGMTVFYWTVSSDGISDEIVAVEEAYVP